MMHHNNLNKFISRFQFHNMKDCLSKDGETHRAVSNSVTSKQFHFNFTHSSSFKVDDLTVVDRFEKHIAFLQKKLSESEKQNTKISSYVEQLKQRIVQSQMFHSILQQRQELQRRQNKRLQLKQQGIQSNYQNILLKIKMDKLSRQVQEQQEVISKIELKHHQHKRGKFSMTFQPLSNPLINLTTPRIYKQKIKGQTQTKQIKNSLQQGLMDQYKRIKQEYSRKQNEAIKLKKQNQILIRDLTNRKKEIILIKKQKINKQQRMNIQMHKLKEKFKIGLKQSKLIFSQLKQTQKQLQKVYQFTKENPNFDQIKLQCSTLKVSPISYNLDIVKLDLNMVVYPNQKQQEGTQTEDVINPEKTQQNKQQTDQQILKLKQLLKYQQQKYNLEQKQAKANCSNDIKQCMNLVQTYKLSIEELNSDISMVRGLSGNSGNVMNQCEQLSSLAKLEIQDNISMISNARVNQNNKNFKTGNYMISVEAQCQLLPINYQQQDLMDKMKVFLELNQDHINKIQELKMINTQYRQQIARLTHALTEATNIQEVSDFQQQEVHVQAQNYSNNQIQQRQMLQQKLNQTEKQLCEMNKFIDKLQEERNHFRNSYQNILSINKQLQSEFQNYVCQAKQQIQAKQMLIQQLTNELQIKSQQIIGHRQQLSENQQRISQLEEELQTYQIKLSQCAAQLQTNNQSLKHLEN